MAQHNVANFLTSRQVAARLGVSRTTVYEMVAKGVIEPPVKFLASARWPADEVAALEQRVRDARRVDAPRTAHAQAA